MPAPLPLAEAEAVLLDLQDRFFAQADRSLLIVLQGIDAAGNDGTIKHVMSGLNPEGVDVYSFKAPSATERPHDYLWRHQTALPELGRIAVFNRSHYENVLVAVTVIAGPLNYFGVNPKVTSCTVPKPS